MTLNMNAKSKSIRLNRKKAPLFTIVGGVVLINPAYAQNPPPQDLEEVIVTGLRVSLQRSADIKREANGVVDAISAEDIGKFPDTNLAESLQRITGISIDRRNGEGAQVTARGFGPQFNMVTLNGRQMPGADAFCERRTSTIGGVGGGTPLIQLLAARFRGDQPLEVYKTGRADIPSRRHRRHDQHQDRPAVQPHRPGHECRRQGGLGRIRALRQRRHAGSVRHLQLRQ